MFCCCGWHVCVSHDNIIMPTLFSSFPLYRIVTVKCTTPLQGSLSIIGASLSEPHVDEFAVEYICVYIYAYIYHTSCHKSLPALILHVLASFINSKTVQKLLSKKTRSSIATARTETSRGPTYSMATVIEATAWQEGLGQS